MKALNPIKLFVLIAICISCPQCGVSAQTVTWVSSHEDIVSVDENGTIEMISEPLETTEVIITASISQHDTTLTISKTVQVDACMACFTFNSLTYCGVWYAGYCWLDRNMGAVNTAQHGSMFYTLTLANSACPTGWRLAEPAEFLEVVRLKTGNSSIDYNTIRNTITVDKMAAAPLNFVPPSNNCQHVYVQGGFFNWGAACPSNSLALYRVADSGGYDMGVRCIRN